MSDFSITIEIGMYTFFIQGEVPEPLLDTLAETLDAIGEQLPEEAASAVLNCVSEATSFIISLDEDKRLAMQAKPELLEKLLEHMSTDKMYKA